MNPCRLAIILWIRNTLIGLVDMAADDGLESKAMQARGCPPPFLDLGEGGNR